MHAEVSHTPISAAREFAFWPRVEGKWSRVEKSSTIIFERRQIKISCLLEFPVPVLFCVVYNFYTPTMMKVILQ